MLPGVEGVGVKNPLLGNSQEGYAMGGRPLPEPGQYPSTDIGRVTPDAMRAMGMRLLSGRFFTEHDDENAAHVCIIDESFAKANFPGENPLGKQVSLGGPPAPVQTRSCLTLLRSAPPLTTYPPLHPPPLHSTSP